MKLYCDSIKDSVHPYEAAVGLNYWKDGWHDLWHGKEIVFCFGECECVNEWAERTNYW